MNQTDLSPLYCVRLEGPESRLDYILGYKPKKDRFPGKDKFLDDLASAFSRACQSCEHEGTRAADLVEHAIEILIEEKDYLLIYQSPLQGISRLKPASEQITITPANRIEVKIPYSLDLEFFRRDNGKEIFKSNTAVKIFPIYELIFSGKKKRQTFLFIYETDPSKEGLPPLPFGFEYARRKTHPNEEEFLDDISNAIVGSLYKIIFAVELGEKKLESSHMITFQDVMRDIVENLSAQGYQPIKSYDSSPINRITIMFRSDESVTPIKDCSKQMLEIYRRIPKEIKERFKKAAEKKENWISPSLYEGYKRELEQQGKKHEF